MLMPFYLSVFQRLHEVRYCSRWKAEAGMRIQLSPIGKHIKEICKRLNNAALLIKCFLFEKTSLFFIKNKLFVLTYNEYVTLKHF